MEKQLSHRARAGAMGVILLLLAAFTMWQHISSAKANPAPVLENGLIPMYMPASNDQLPIYFELASLDANTSYYVKARVKQGGKYYGEVLNVGTGLWLGQSSPWTNFPQASSDQDGRLKAWMTLRSDNALITTVDASLELVLRPFGTTSNLPAVLLSSIDVFQPVAEADDPGGYIGGTMIDETFSDTSDLVVAGIMNNDTVACTGSVYKSSSDDTWSQSGSSASLSFFRTPCPVGLARFELLTTDELQILELTEDIYSEDGEFRSDIVFGASPVPGPTTTVALLTESAFYPTFEAQQVWVNGVGLIDGGTDSNITAIEYFVGKDPGEGLGNAVAALDGSFDTAEEHFELLVDPSIVGTNDAKDRSIMIGLRALDSTGRWSTVEYVEIMSYNHVFSDEQRGTIFYMSPKLGHCAFVNSKYSAHSQQCKVKNAGDYGYFVTVRDAGWNFAGLYYSDDEIFAGRSWLDDSSDRVLIVDDGVDIVM